MMKARLNARFILEPREPARAWHRLRQDFDGYNSPDFGMNPTIDLTHPARADVIYEPVIADRCIYQVRPGHCRKGESTTGSTGNTGLKKVFQRPCVPVLPAVYCIALLLSRSRGHQLQGITNRHRERDLPAGPTGKRPPCVVNTDHASAIV